MDDLAGGLLLLAVGAALFFVYVAVAGGAALVLAVAAAVDALGFFLWRVGGMLWRAVACRGGDRRVVCAPEPAFEIYVGRPLVGDFQAAFATGLREVFAQAAVRRGQAFSRFTGAMVPLAFGATIGAYAGAAIGALVGGAVAICGGLLLGVACALVWVGARVLQAFERTRRRVRGAHFDCPSCHERSALPVYVCPGCGAKHRQLLPGRWGIRHRRCGCDRVVLPVLESTGRHALAAECPLCQYAMPGASGIAAEIAVPLVGGPRSGKTAYLASLLIELDALTQTGATRLSVVASSRAAFDRLLDDLRRGRAPQKTQIRHATPAFVGEVRSGTKRSALLYVHDIAGELYQHADHVRDTPYLQRARGIVVLIDPFSLHPVAQALDRERPADSAAISPSDEHPQHVIERFLQALRETGRSDLRKLPIAIVLSKTDALTDGPAPGRHGTPVTTWLQRHGAANLVRMIQTEFDTTEFFAASALGRLPDTTTTPFSPAGTLTPLIWLLKANNITLTAAAATTTHTVTETLDTQTTWKTVSPYPQTPILAPTTRTPKATAAGITAAALLLSAATATALSFTQPGAGTTDTSASASRQSNLTRGSSEADQPSGAASKSEPEDSVPTTGPSTATRRSPPAARILRRHYQLIDRGEYSEAFDLMSAGYRATNDNWTSVRADARPSINVENVGTPRYGSGFARVPITFYTRDSYDTRLSNTNCYRFTGRAFMVKRGSRWRYDPQRTHYTRSRPLPSDNPHCPS